MSAGILSLGSSAALLVRVTKGRDITIYFDRRPKRHVRALPKKESPCRIVWLCGAQRMRLANPSVGPNYLLTVFSYRSMRNPYTAMWSYVLRARKQRPV